MATVTYSVSSWQQPVPRSASPQRDALLDQIAARALALTPARPAVGIDGGSSAGKTNLGHELATRIAAAGRPVLRACLDDFKRPWAERFVVDRESPEGLYRNAFDYPALRRLLLEPFGAGPPGEVALCGIDPLTQVDHSTDRIPVPPTAVLIVDGVFAFRPGLHDAWDLRIWLERDRDVALRRSAVRDQAWAGSGSEQLMLTRYLPAEDLYRAEADPVRLAHLVIDNSDHTRPRLLRED